MVEKSLNKYNSCHFSDGFFLEVVCGRYKLGIFKRAFHLRLEVSSSIFSFLQSLFFCLTYVSLTSEVPLKKILCVLKKS